MTIRLVTSQADNGSGSFRAILAAAKAGDTIKFSSRLSGKTITLTSGQLAIKTNVIIDGADAKGLKISGNNASRIFFIQGVQHWIPLNVTIRNLTITNGKTKGVGAEAGGGAIWTETGTHLTVENSKFINNRANGIGGGAILSGWGARITVLKSLFDGNTTQGNDSNGKKSERAGGAIAIRTGTLIVKDSQFKNNIGLNGGAINGVRSDITVENSTFFHNDSTPGGPIGPHTIGYGGAIYTDGAGGMGNTPGTIRISKSRFDSNIAAGQGGGLFLWNYPGDKTIIEDSTIINNQVIYDRGGISFGGGLRHGNGELEIKNTTFAYNHALQQGGGLGAVKTFPITIDNSTFYGNKVESPDGKQGLGGGIFLSNGSAKAKISNSTLANNYAGFQGGGIWGAQNTLLSKSIFDDNVAHNGGRNWNVFHHTGSAFIDGGGNFQSPHPNPKDIKVTPSATLIDPKLPVFVDNGRAVQTPLIPGNPRVIGGSGSRNSDHLSPVSSGSPTIPPRHDPQLGGTRHNNPNTPPDRDPINGVSKTEPSTNPNLPGSMNPAESRLLDLRDYLTGIVHAEFSVSHRANYDNSFGFYAVDDVQGRIGKLKPGDSGYANAAVSNRVDLDQGLPGGHLLAPFLIADGTPKEFLARNPRNKIGEGMLAYFAYSGANPDRMNHIRQLSNNTFAFEDVLYGGDRDFNDLTVKVHLT